MSQLMIKMPNIDYDKYKIIKKLSQGSFGIVYLGRDTKNNRNVAIKIEKFENHKHLTLNKEYQYLQELSHINGIPQVYEYQQSQQEACLIMQLLGKDLQSYLRKYRKFSLKCLANIAEQVLVLLEAIHKNSILHQDIKPENILVGRDKDSQTIYLLDYGISKHYRNKAEHHSQFISNKPFIGTARYASIAAHQGYEQGRKDDLESLGYVLIYLSQAKLPWIIDKHYDDNNIKIAEVGKIKQKTSISELCKGLPNAFNKYFEYVKQLNFKSSPDYKYLISLFKLMLLNNGIVNNVNQKFDWSEQYDPKYKLKSSTQFEQSPPLLQHQKKKSFLYISDQSSNESYIQNISSIAVGFQRSNKSPPLSQKQIAYMKIQKRAPKQRCQSYLEILQVSKKNQKGRQSCNRISYKEFSQKNEKSELQLDDEFDDDFLNEDINSLPYKLISEKYSLLKINNVKPCFKH